MEKESTMISVAMGVYYKSDDISFLSRAVNSILSQSYKDFEFLIADDGSGERAKQYLRDVAEKDKRVKLLRGFNALSLSQKLNICIKNAKGKYIARMDDDDYSYPTRFEKQLCFLEAHPEYAFVGSQINLFCEGEIIKEHRFPLSPMVKDFYITQPFCHPALMFRRDALIKTGGYCEKERANKCEDYDLLLRLYANGQKGFNLPYVLMNYTKRADAHDGRNMKDRINEMKTRYACYEKLNMLPLALPFVIKPLTVAMMPSKLLGFIKDMR